MIQAGHRSYVGSSSQTDCEAEAAVLRPPDAKSRLPGKDSDAGKD